MRRHDFTRYDYYLPKVSCKSYSCSFWAPRPSQYSLTESLFLNLEAILPTIKHPAIGGFNACHLSSEHESEYVDYATSRKHADPREKAMAKSAFLKPTNSKLAPQDKKIIATVILVYIYDLPKRFNWPWHGLLFKFQTYEHCFRWSIYLTCMATIDTILP